MKIQENASEQTQAFKLGFAYGADINCPGVPISTTEQSLIDNNLANNDTMRRAWFDGFEAGIQALSDSVKMYNRCIQKKRNQ